MRQYRTLLGYEMKKICCRRSTWITIAVLVLAFLVSVTLTWNMSYTHILQAQEDDGTGQEENEGWYDTYAQRKARERKNGIYWSGRKIDDALLMDIFKGYEDTKDKIGTVGNIKDIEHFTKELERFELLESTLDAIAGTEGILPQSYYMQESGRLTEEKLYQRRDAVVEEHQASYKLTKDECSYWQQKEKSLTKPFTYQYADGFYQMISMNGVYMVALFSSFLLAVVVSRIFAEEHQRRLDQIILCSRFGREKLYFVKIVAGSLFAFFATSIMAGVVMAVTFICYGTEGFSAVIQLIAGWYSYPLTVGQILLIMLGICVISALLTSIFIMVVSEKFRSSMAGMVIAVLTVGAARIIVIPRELRLLSQVWNFFPMNLLKIDQGFLDVRLVSVFGVKMTIWQFAPILYLILGIILVLLGKRCYSRYQVQGR